MAVKAYLKLSGWMHPYLELIFNELYFLWTHLYHHLFYALQHPATADLFLTPVKTCFFFFSLSSCKHLWVLVMYCKVEHIMKCVLPLLTTPTVFLWNFQYCEIAGTSVCLSTWQNMEHISIAPRGIKSDLLLWLDDVMELVGSWPWSVLTAVSPFDTSLPFSHHRLSDELKNKPQGVHLNIRDLWHLIWFYRMYAMCVHHACLTW